MSEPDKVRLSRNPTHRFTGVRASLLLRPVLQLATVPRDPEQHRERAVRPHERHGERHQERQGNPQQTHPQVQQRQAEQDHPGTLRNHLRRKCLGLTGGYIQDYYFGGLGKF